MSKFLYPMNLETIIGIIAGICTSSAMLPQVVKTIKTKKAEEVALGMLLTLTTGIALWVVYGWMKKDIPIIATNCFALLVNMVMIFLRAKYGKGK